MDALLPQSNILAVGAALSIAGLIVIDCAKDFQRLVSARNAFLLTIMCWYCLEAVLVPEEIHVYGQFEYNVAVLTLIGLVLAFLAGYNNFKGRAFDPLFTSLAKVDSPKLIWRVFVLAVVIGFLPLIVYSSGNLLLILEDAFVPKARFAGFFQRGRYGGIRDAMLELQMFLRAAIPLAAALLAHKGIRKDKQYIAVVFLVFMFARAFNSGTRSQVIEVFLPLAAAAYWRFSVNWKRLAIIYGLPALAAIGMVWSAATVISRNDGGVDWEKAADAKYVGFEMFRELLFIQKNITQTEQFQVGYTYYVQLCNPIPRFLWPNKPDGDAGLQLAKMQGAGEGADAYLTISPGLVGEMYWNFGYFGVIGIGAFLGYLASSWDRIREYATTSILAFTAYAAGLAIIFLSGRSVNMSTLYGLIALSVLLIYFSRSTKVTVRKLPAYPTGKQKAEGVGQ